MQTRDRSPGALVLLAWLALSFPALAAVRPGAAAPEFSLEQARGGHVALSELLRGGPVVLWFADLEGGTGQGLHQLQQAAQESGTQLLVIPMVGPDREVAVQLAEAEPALKVLLDPDGRVTLLYTGEFVVGVAPRENLYVINSTGTVRAVRFFPGIPPGVLTSLLQHGD